jgi:SAM-dependent methyltransferase
VNEFSADWYRIFLEPYALELTSAEVAFVARQLPPGEFPELLDVCCGPGRHAAALASLGYRVLGVDVNPDAIARARAAVPKAEFRVLDMRALASLERRFDAVTNLWHSFGYFDDAANEAVLREVRERLRPGGRFLLDVYNRAHFAPMPAEAVSERSGVRIRTRRSWRGQRLRIELEYDGRPGDTFEWRLYTPDELAALLESLGLRVRTAVAWCREDLAPSAEHARMQFVAERS